MKKPNSELDALLDEALNNSAAPLTTTVHRPGKKPTKARYNKAANTVLTDACIKVANKSPRTPKSIGLAFQNFEQAVGGRVELHDLLQHCPAESPAYKAIARLFKDVDFNSARDVALDVICSRNKVDLAKLLLAFRESLLAKTVVETVTRLSSHVPVVVDDVADDAKNRYRTCSVCEGTARVPRIGDNGEFALDVDGNEVTQLCYECRGTGHLYAPHDSQSRKLFFQLTGLLKPEGKDRDLQPINIANISGNFTPGDGSYEYLIKAIDRVSIPSHAQSLDDEAIEVPYALYDTTLDTVPSQGPEASQNPSADPA